MTKAKAPKAKPELARMDALEERMNEQDNKLSQVVDILGDIASKVESIAAVPAGTAAKDAPAVVSYYTEAAEQFIGGPGEASFSETSDGEQVIVQSMEGDVDSAAFKDYQANLAFNTEELEIEIHTTSDKDANKAFTIFVNGRPFIFQRGKKYRVPRYAVEGLARSKPVGYQYEERMNSHGLKESYYPSERGVRYPFSLVNASSRDSAWLQSILAQP